MELSPQAVAATTFKTVKKGYDPAEVRAYLSRLATAIEATQTQAAAMEARARAAVARLQELATQQPATAKIEAPTTPTPAPAPLVVAPTPAPAPPAREATVDEAETISRTLLLAQRTADTTVAEAKEEAERITAAARADAQRLVDAAQEERDRAVEEAKAEARRASEDQRVQIDSEVQSLLARREFLLSDVEHLEQHVVSHRDRLRDVASSLVSIADNTVGGLADLRRPIMSHVSDTETAAAPAGAPSTSLDEPTMAMPRLVTADATNEVDRPEPIAMGPAGDDDETAAESPELDPTPAAGVDTPDTGATEQVPTVGHLNDDLFGITRNDLR